MQEFTFFQPQPKKVFVTKKHFAIMLLVWWLLVQFYDFIIFPAGILVYEAIFEEGSMKFYDNHKQQNQQKQSKDISQQDNLSNKQRKKVLSKSKKQVKIQSIEIDELQTLKEQNIEANFKKLQQIKSGDKQFKIHFKIKGNINNIQDIKSKATSESLKQAMQQYFSKNKTKNKK